MHAPSLTVLVSASDIQRRIQELAAQIDLDYRNGSLYFVGVLKGACFFLADLARAVKRPVRLDFVAASSYGSGQISSGEVRLTKDLDDSIEGADVILIEDIVDTGITVSYLLKHLECRRPRSVRVAALLDKPSRRQGPVDLHYVGFPIPNKFVVGYGLDFAGDYRALPDICVLGE